MEIMILIGITAFAAGWLTSELTKGHKARKVGMVWPPMPYKPRHRTRAAR